MAPSKESQALKELFKKLTASFPKDGDPFLTRCVYDQVHTAGAEPTGVSYENILADGVPALWITPENASRDHVILYMHGGAFQFGSSNGHRKLAAHLAKACNCVSVSVDYRLTPEHPFPAGLDDCVAVYKWLLEKGYQAQKVVVAGDSCGGGLSASVPLAALQQGLSIPGAAVAMSPWYDLNGGYESYKTNAENDMISAAEGMDVNADKYLAGASREDPLASPMRADMSGLPPTWISCPGHDILVDQGRIFAEKANKAGVEVVLEVHEGQQHVMEFMAGKAPEADESLKRIGEWVRKKIGS